MYHGKIEHEQNPTSILQHGDLVVGVDYNARSGNFAAEWLGGAPASDDQVVALWLFTPVSNQPIALCVLNAMERIDIALPENIETTMRTGLLAISNEPANALPIHQPTGDLLAIGSAVAA